MSLLLPVEDRPRVYLAKENFTRVVYHSLPLDTLLDISENTVRAGAVVNVPVLGGTIQGIAYKMGRGRQKASLGRILGRPERQRAYLASMCSHLFMDYTGEGDIHPRYREAALKVSQIPRFRKAVIGALNESNREFVGSVEQDGLRYFWDVVKTERGGEQDYRKLWALLSSDSALHNLLAAAANRRLKFRGQVNFISSVVGNVSQFLEAGVQKLASYADRPAAELYLAFKDIENKLKERGWDTDKIEAWKRYVSAQIAVEVGKQYGRVLEAEQGYREQTDLARELQRRLTGVETDLVKEKVETDRLKREKDKIEKDVDKIRKDAAEEGTEERRQLGAENNRLRGDIGNRNQRIRILEGEVDRATDLALDEAGKLRRALTEHEAEYRRLETDLEGSEWDPQLVTAILARAPYLLTSIGNGFPRDRLRKAAQAIVDVPESEIDGYIDRFVQTGALVQNNGSLLVPEHSGKVADRNLRRYVAGLNEIKTEKT